MNIDERAGPTELEIEVSDVLSLSHDSSESGEDANAPGGEPPSEPPAAGSPATPSEAAAGSGPVPTPAADTSLPSMGASEASSTPAAPEPAPAPAPSGEPAPSAAPAAQPAAQPPAGDAALREASLQATVDALQRRIDDLTKSGAQPQEAPSAQPASSESGQPSATQPQTPRYALTLPQQVQEAILSEDPQQNIAAIQHIVNDLGTIVHASVVAQMRSEFQGAFQQLISAARQGTEQETRLSAAQSAREDYYKAFPQHNDPLILPIIQSESQKLAAEFPNVSWSPDYINSLGTRVDAFLAKLRGGSAPADPAPQPGPGNTPPARPAPMMPSGTRGGDAGNFLPVAAETDLIEDTLNPFGAG